MVTRCILLNALGAAIALAVVGMPIVSAAQPDQSPQPTLGAAVNSYAPTADVYARYQGDGEIHPWRVQGQVWLLGGEPGESNVAVQIGAEGVLIVDTGIQTMASKLLEQIKQLIQLHAAAQSAIRFIVNTNGLSDHIGGNQVIRDAGSTVAGGSGGAGFLFVAPNNVGITRGATVIANQNVLTRLVAASAAGDSSAPQALWPTETEDLDISGTIFNGEPLQLYHPHNANTDGQLMVLFRRSDVIAAGDVLDMTGYPVIDASRGGSIDGELVALNQLIDMAVAGHGQEGGTLIIPGHGRLCDQSDAVHYKDMLTIIRNRVQLYKNQGKTLQQVLALAPSGDYEQRWGSTGGRWTTRDFIAAVYASLPKQGPVFSMRSVILVPSTIPLRNGETF
jgi:glyoxylase-like metal-dependent hydrolase (beta-lactamase superfamily II)